MSEFEPVYPLREAVKLFLGDAWTVTSLRTEIKKGRLQPLRIAGRLAVTRSAISEMMRQCLEKPKPRVSGSEIAEAVRPSGLSSTEDGRLALVAAQQTLEELKGHSRATSRKSTTPRKGKAISQR